MKTYIVDKCMKDVRDVAGMPNPGVGKPIDLTDEQAKHPLRQGHINLKAGAKVSVDASKSTSETKTKGK